MPNHKISIENETVYNATMKEIDALMRKGDKSLTKEELELLRSLAIAAQAYEETIYKIPSPQIPEGFD